MRLLTLFRLRTAIPLILVLYSLGLGILFLHSHLSWADKNIEEVGRNDLRVTLAQTQRTLEYFLLRNDIATVQQNISILSLNPRTLHVYLICDNGTILASSRLGTINKTLTNVAPSLSGPEQELLAAQIERTHDGTNDIRLSADRNGLISVTTISMPASTERDSILWHGHGHSHATLCLYHDLELAKRSTRQAITNQALMSSLLLGLLALVLWTYFHLVLGRRIASLSTMAEEIGKGNYKAPSNISGHDELASLARSFEEMRDNLLRSFETIRQREEALRETQAIAHMGSWELDTASKKLYWSEETYRLFGIAENKPLSYANFLATIHPEDRGGVDEAIQRSIRQATGVSLNYRIITNDNKVRYLHEESEVVVDESGKVIKRKGSVQDITEHQEATLAMERSMREWLVAMDASDDVIYLLDPERHLIRANSLFYRLTGSTPESAIGCHISALIHPQGETALCAVCQAQEERRDALITMEANDPDNPAQRPIEVGLKIVRDKQGDVLSMLVTIHDLTSARQELQARTELEKQLQQAQKMEAVGTLAGGIAHDFNNILTPIIGYTELALATLPAESETAQDLAEVLQAGHRAKELVSQILTFSRQGGQAQHPLHMQLVIKEALKLLRASIPTTIDIKTTIDQQCAPVLASPTQIHQIIMNLCTNAYHAMRETGGALTVTLSQRELGPHATGALAALQPGSYALLEISDTGQGMSTSVRNKIFDPYFTTKAKGEGTGLGLSVVHGIVNNLAGHISVSSEPGQGTTFHIYLPISAEDVRAEESSAIGSVLPGGQEHILVVDDEQAIAHLHQMVLESLGYEVTLFTSSEAALNSFKSQPQAFDLLITDMTMPHLDGAQLSKEILALRPAMPIIICTGFSDLISAQQATEIGISKFLMKPVVKKDIAQAVREALDNKAEATI